MGDRGWRVGDGEDCRVQVTEFVESKAVISALFSFYPKRFRPSPIR
jgi:hypothetical protein